MPSNEAPGSGRPKSGENEGDAARRCARKQSRREIFAINSMAFLYLGFSYGPRYLGAKYWRIDRAALRFRRMGSRRRSALNFPMQVRPGRPKSGDLLTDQCRREAKLRDAKQLGEWAIGRLMYTPPPMSWASGAGLAPKGTAPITPKARIISTPRKLIGVATLSICYSRIIGGNPDAQRTYPRLRPILHQRFGRRTSTSSIAMRPGLFRPSQPPRQLLRNQRTQRPAFYGASAMCALYQNRKERAVIIPAGRDRRIDRARAEC